MDQPMQDYQSGGAKPGEAKSEKKQPKDLKKVVSGEVTVPKKSLGRKIKDVVREADFKGVMHYVVYDIMIPAGKNMLVDAVSAGARRAVYRGRDAYRQVQGPGGGSYTTYNRPIDRGYPQLGPGQQAPRPSMGPRTTSRYDRADFILSSREDADSVLETMTDIIDKYGEASVSDLLRILGRPTNFVDDKWGWVSLVDVPIRQIREGWLMEFPPAEPLNEH